jgi:hypothetical protein
VELDIMKNKGIGSTFSWLFNRINGYDPSLTRSFHIAGTGVRSSAFVRNSLRVLVPRILEAQQPGLKATCSDDTRDGSLIFDIGLDDDPLYALTHAFSLFSLSQDSDRERAKITLKGNHLRDYTDLQRTMRTSFNATIGDLATNFHKRAESLRDEFPDDWLSTFTIWEEESNLVKDYNKGVLKSIEKYDNLDRYKSDTERATQEFGLYY